MGKGPNTDDWLIKNCLENVCELSNFSGKTATASSCGLRLWQPMTALGLGCRLQEGPH